MAHSAPFLVSPRLDAKPWGGRRLGEFGFALPADVAIGEALITASEAAVVSGAMSGRTLGDVVTDDPLRTMGRAGLAATAGKPVFPLLIKLIDAADDLSIQVHPDDDAAPAGSLGKTEAWHVLDARPNSFLYLGLQDPAVASTLAEQARAGISTAGLLRAVPAVVGTTVFLPAGTLHALGAGVLIYEIQQPSAITYRLDDWGRTDAKGHPRELHLDAGLAVMRPEVQPVPERPLATSIPGGRRSLLVSCRYFAAERIELEAGGALRLNAPDSPQTITCIEGNGLVEVLDGGHVVLRAGSTAVAFADCPDLTLRSRSPLVVLRGWVPLSTGAAGPP